MWIAELTIRNCRNINNLTLEFSPHVNFIYGSNGSGKTSILEALSMLSYGRSFRTSRIADVISYHEQSVISSAITISELNGEKRIGIEKSRDKTTIRVNRQNLKSQANLSKLIPISVIHPLSYQLISGGSSIRRSFIDWIAFYKYPEFHTIWKRYSALLKQRNAALKTPKLFYAIDHLTIELCKLQLPIHNFRLLSLTQLNKTLAALVPKNLKEFIPDIVLKTGLPTAISLETDSLIDYYNTIREYERKRGRTIKGVHTADLAITLDSVPVFSSASRGQIKTMTTLLCLCQNLAINGNGIICIDDLSAEVDTDNYNKILDFILSIGSQVFITSTSEPTIKNIDCGFRMFHVEHGHVDSYVSRETNNDT